MLSPTGNPIRNKNIMAKSSSVPGLDRVRELFTSAERAVLEATAGSTFLAASRKQVEKTLAQARSLRDKWRDLHAGQARTTKRTAAAGPASNARSREKADMFTAAIDRLQARLAELGRGTAPAKPVAGKSVTKAARQAGHRTTRASVKGKLAAAAAEINTARSPRPAAKPAARPVAAVLPAVAPAPVAKSKKAGKKQRPTAKAAAVLAKGGGQPLRFDAVKQRSAKASATRIKLDGKLSRRGGHTLAAGKRRQAARDQRSR